MEFLHFPIITFFSIVCICNASPLQTTAETNTTVLGYTTRGSLYILDNQLVKWNNARLACSSSDLVLATIENEKENREVYAFLSHLEGSSNVWTAGNDIYENGKYVWGTNGDSPITYFDWISGSPPNDPTCGCISIVHTAANSCGRRKCTGWQESICNEPRKSLCMLRDTCRAI